MVKLPFGVTAHVHFWPKQFCAAGTNHPQGQWQVLPGLRFPSWLQAADLHRWEVQQPSDRWLCPGDLGGKQRRSHGAGQQQFLYRHVERNQEQRMRWKRVELGQGQFQCGELLRVRAKARLLRCGILAGLGLPVAVVVGRRMRLQRRA